MNNNDKNLIASLEANDGDYGCSCHLVTFNAATRLRELLSAITKHRDAKGHDRCWENDLELYKILGEPLPVSNEMPPEKEFEKRCKEYYHQQCSKKCKE